MSTGIKIYPNYIKELLVLAMPIIMGNLGVVLISAGSVFVAGKYSTDTLASIGIANTVINCIFMFGVGLLTSISPILSNFRGGKKSAKKYFFPTVLFALILAFFSSILIFSGTFFIEKIGFESKLVPMIKQVIMVCSLAPFGGYLYVALKEYLQAFEIVFFPNLIAAISIVLNIFLSFIFVFGLFGIPEMGTLGIALSFLLINIFQGACLLIFCLKAINCRKYFDIKYFKNLIKVGLPISFAILFEFLAFNIITIIMGRTSGIYAAGQNILLTITTATFMIPLSISTALAVKVGFANGAGNVKDLRGYSIAGTGISVGFMGFCALCFIVFPENFIKIFTQDALLIKICAPIMIIIGLFQIFDGLQVSLSGIFKGLKKTNIVMAGGFFAYWVVGLPLGYILAFKYNMNLYGFWVGLAIALFILSLILLLILIRNFMVRINKNI